MVSLPPIPTLVRSIDRVVGKRPATQSDTATLATELHPCMPLGQDLLDARGTGKECGAAGKACRHPQIETAEFEATLSRLTPQNFTAFVVELALSLFEQGAQDGAPLLQASPTVRELIKGLTTTLLCDGISISSLAHARQKLIICGQESAAISGDSEQPAANRHVLELQFAAINEALLEKAQPFLADLPTDARSMIESERVLCPETLRGAIGQRIASKQAYKTLVDSGLLYEPGAVIYSALGRNIDRVVFSARLQEDPTRQMIEHLLRRQQDFEEIHGGGLTGTLGARLTFGRVARAANDKLGFATGAIVAHDVAAVSYCLQQDIRRQRSSTAQAIRTPPEVRLPLASSARGRDGVQGAGKLPQIRPCRIAVQAVRVKLRELYPLLTDWERKQQTIAVAGVRTAKGDTEYWVAAAGKEGAVRTGLRLGHHYIIDKGEERTRHENHAEKRLLRAALAEGAIIQAIGATRPICEECAKQIPVEAAASKFKVKPTG